jgi:hypothetical protein
MLNWGVHYRWINPDASRHGFLNHLLVGELQLAEFRRQVFASSGRAEAPHVQINRLKARDVRDGTSTDFTRTIIHQLAARFGDTAGALRAYSDGRPWNVDFAEENGLDAGGLARELVTEAAADLTEPRCGLVIPVPNARAEVGGFREFVLPRPAPGRGACAREFRFAGALIGIAIRCGLAQDFNFPPLVWDFLLAGEVRIEHVYEIDQTFFSLMTSLQEAHNRRMSEAEFAAAFSLRFVVMDSAGQEAQLTQRGRAQPVTPANVGEYLALSKEFRVNELRPYLEAMRGGLWDNLGIQPPGFKWTVLEYLACGEKTITPDQFRQGTVMMVDGGRAAMFWQVIDQLTSDERLLLLKFATGRSRLPPASSRVEHWLRVDGAEGSDLMPTASTCFNALHMPRYSSVAVAVRCFRAAVTFTGTFEKG